MGEQLAFELPHRPALGAEDFLVSESNRLAVRLIDSWPSWPGPVHVIVGPRGCGKSHLANVWRLKSGAEAANAAALQMGRLNQLTRSAALVVEDADRRGGNEEAFFHLLNLCRERRISLLITARSLPKGWPLALPDLVSRVRSLPAITIGAPDDDLLRAVLVKHFLDRQLDVPPRVISYLAMRMERSMEAAAEVAQALDQAALEAGRKITRQFAAEVLSRLQRQAGAE